MSFLGNIVWLIFGGLFTGLSYIISGLLICITIIGIPFGMQAIRVGMATFAPFGKSYKSSDDNGILKTVFNIIWLIFFGWEIALMHITSAGILAVTIIGLPFAYQHLKLIPISLLPFGRDLVKES
ncbi:MAG: YccF domain-containing protein [Leptospiraceae bacterium]|nr:YccF domain-containing protein [Leptospiraceae bacterium]MCP5512328.1 YccF domain-containing protein [Leptospiraceae bacterium]